MPRSVFLLAILIAPVSTGSHAQTVSPTLKFGLSSITSAAVQTPVIGGGLAVKIGTTTSIEVDVLKSSGLHKWQPAMWEFPIFVKYPLFMKGLRPYVFAGASVARVRDLPEAIVCALGPCLSNRPVSSNGNSRSAVAALYGLGLSIRWGRVWLSPEMRYHHWSSGASDGVALSSNRADLLLGIRF